MVGGGGGGGGGVERATSCSLQITASILSVYFFIKAHVVGTHLNCFSLLMQLK